MAAAVLSAAHWLARPHLFTMLAGGAAARAAASGTGRRTLWPYVAALRGLGQPARRVLLRLHHRSALYAAGELIEGAARRRARPGGVVARARHHLRGARRRRSRRAWSTPTAAQLLAHVAGFFGNSAILRQTQEFMSPDFHTINGKFFLLVLLGVIAHVRADPAAAAVPVLLIAPGQHRLLPHLAAQHRALRAAWPCRCWRCTYDAEWRALPVLQRRQGGVPAGARRAATAASGAAICALLLAGAGPGRRQGRRRGGDARPVRPQGLPGARPSAKAPGRAAAGADVQQLHLGRLPAARAGRSSGSSSTAAPTTTGRSCSTSTSRCGISSPGGVTS